MLKKLKLTCIYLNVNNLEKSVDFYTSLFETEIDKRFEDRWVQVKTPNGFVVGLLNNKYDERIIKGGKNLEKHYDQEFIKNMTSKYTAGNTVVLNLKAENFEEEYRRVKGLKPKYISKIQYVNFMFPYHFFMVQDPDGNLIEISDA